MLKNILNLEGAQELTKNEQKTITGGLTDCQNRAIIEGGCFLNPHPTQSCFSQGFEPVCTGTVVCC